jgi:hypothetical protein
MRDVFGAVEHSVEDSPRHAQPVVAFVGFGEHGLREVRITDEVAGDPPVTALVQGAEPEARWIGLSRPVLRPCLACWASLLDSGGAAVVCHAAGEHIVHVRLGPGLDAAHHLVQ